MCPTIEINIFSILLITGYIFLAKLENIVPRILHASHDLFVRIKFV